MSRATVSGNPNHLLKYLILNIKTVTEIEVSGIRTRRWIQSRAMSSPLIPVKQENTGKNYSVVVILSPRVSTLY